MAKIIVRYLEDIMQIGLVFGREVNSHLLKDPPPYGFIGYMDSNFTEDPVD